MEGFILIDTDVVLGSLSLAPRVAQFDATVDGVIWEIIVAAASTTWLVVAWSTAECAVLVLDYLDLYIKVAQG